MKLNGTHQLLAYADDVNLLGDNIGAIKKNKETITDAVKKAGLEINIEYMLLFHYQNEGQNHYTNTANTYFENVSQLIYLGMTNKLKFDSGGIKEVTEFL
jgi:hypothetical protein